MATDIQLLQNILDCKNFRCDFERWTKQIALDIKNTQASKGAIAIFGNGGSAADAQHWAAELVCTYMDRSRQPYAAMALTTDTSIITAWSNDFKFEEIFERQVEAFRNIYGLAIGLSTSGKSKNVIRGLRKAQQHGIKTILISGEGAENNSEYGLHVRLPSQSTPIVQTLTQMLYHEVCNQLE